MFVQFWGTRGSIPSPQSGEVLRVELYQWLVEQQVKGRSLAEAIQELSQPLSALPREFKPAMFGGETTCIEVGTNESNSFFIDAGTGLRQVCKGRTKKNEFDILLTHVHWDHILGLPFFEPIFSANSKIRFYYIHEHAPDHLRILFNGINFPVAWNEISANVEFIQLKKYKEFEIAGCKLIPFCLDHPGESFGFRIESNNKSIAICTDSSFDRFTKEELGADYEYYQGLDLIVFDAQYDSADYAKKKSYGHCTPAKGLALARRERIKQLVFTHHDPTYPSKKIYEMLEGARREATLNAGDFTPELLSAFDGMRIKV